MAMTLAHPNAQALPFEQTSSSPLASRVLINRSFLREIISAQRQGKGCLPADLGLGDAGFSQLIEHFFHGDAELLRWRGDSPEHSTQLKANSELRAVLLQARAEEGEELRDLLFSYLYEPELSGHWMASIVTAACMGTDHLWRDLGLSSRAVLNQLLRHNFPALVAENNADMKWKKFLYRKLCETGGDYVCRSPSCDACVSYDDCFGSEEH